MIFLECSFVLNAAPVTNTILSYIWLSICFFLMFFFYILTTFSFYRLFDNVLMKMYSLCCCCGDKKSFKETKMCGVIASKWIFAYFRVLFAEPKNEFGILSSISFLNYKSQKSNIFENVLEFRQETCHWNVLIVLGYW